MATADATLEIGDVVVLKDRANGIFDVVTVGTTAHVDLPNAYNIIVSTADATKCLVLRAGDKPDLKQFGGIGDDSTDTTAATEAWIDYLIAKDLEGGANNGTFLIDTISKVVNSGLKLSGNATFKATGSNRQRMFRFTGCQGLFSMDGLTFDGNDTAALPFSVENESSTASTQGSVYIGPSARFINAKNNSPDTNTVTGCFIRGGFKSVIFEGEVDGADDDRTSGCVTEGLTVTHFTTATDDWVKNTVITGKARFRNIKNSNSVLADADGLKVDAPTSKIAHLTVQGGAYFENCEGRSIKSQVVGNTISSPVIYRSLYDGLDEINLQYAGGSVSGAKLYYEGTRVDSVIAVTERLSPDNLQCSVLNNELTVTGTPSSDTRAMVQFNVTDATVKSQGITVRGNKVKGSIEHVYRWIVGNQVDENRAIVSGNWAETVSGTFVDLSVQGSSPAQPSIVFTDNGCQNACTGATGNATLLVEYERSNHNITTLSAEPYELTIATGVIKAYAGTHKVDTEANAASDNLDTINTDGRGQDEWLTLKLETSSRAVVVKHATGNIRLDGSADFTLSDVRSSLTLAYNTALSEWNEISRVTSS